MSELRVPPAVTMKFENTAHYVCNKAKLDFDEWPLHIHEFVTHLQDRWREGIDLGLDTDQAEERALQLFGNLNKVARSVRKHWFKRLIYDDRCRVNRYVIIFLSATLLTFFGTAKRYPVGTKIEVGSIEYSFILGSFLNCFYGMGSLAVIRWKPDFKHAILRWAFGIRYILGIFVLTLFINITLISYNLLFAYSRQLSDGINIIYFFLVFISVILGTLGAMCMISELFNLPGRAKRKQGRCSRVIAV
jgi:hypothetical protein